MREQIIKDITEKVMIKLAEQEMLSSHKINLSLVDDYYKKLNTSLGTAITNYENLLTQITKEKDKLKKVYDKINNEGNLLYKEYDIKARELGVAMNDIPNFKKMWEFKTYLTDLYYKIIEK